MNEQWKNEKYYWEHLSRQGSQEWLNARKGRVTGSVAGALVGRSRFKTPEDQGLIIAGVVTETFNGNDEIMQHGTLTEPFARDWFAKKYNYNIVERGLIVPKWDPTLGASVDGDILNTDGIIEIKCPLKMYKPIQIYMDHKANGIHIDGYNHIWKTHYDQMQLGMVVMNKKWCEYIVYCTPYSSVFTQKIPFDKDYWEKSLYPKIKTNYKKLVLPHLANTVYPIVPR